MSKLKAKELRRVQREQQSKDTDDDIAMIERELKYEEKLEDIQRTRRRKEKYDIEL